DRRVAAWTSDRNRRDGRALCRATARLYPRALEIGPVPGAGYLYSRSGIGGVLDADILIRNGIVVTIDDDRRVLEDGAVAIIGDRIAAIGTTDELSAWTAGKII